MGGPTSAEVKNRWNKENYDRITVMLPKGDKEKLKQYADSHGIKSVNALIIAALEDFMK